nr:hypothetical protein [uncultured Sunxiuqinia sp.]
MTDQGNSTNKKEVNQKNICSMKNSSTNSNMPSMEANPTFQKNHHKNTTIISNKRLNLPIRRKNNRKKRSNTFILIPTTKKM